MKNTEKQIEEKLQGKTAAVVGIGMSNRPLIDFLLAHGVSVTARDIKPREKLGDFADTLEAKGVKLKCGDGYLDDITEELIFRAPGIRYDKPGFVKAVENGSVLTSEMELFFELTPATLIGITGSDGKTTTTTLTYMMLRDEGYNVYVGGNIGKPLLPEVEKMKEGDIAVIELSSFQLHTMKLSPHISAITNLSPNHLDYHTDMNEYVAAKTNIFTHPSNRKIVLNYANAPSRELASLVRPDAETVYFRSDSEEGVYEKDGAIYYGGERIVEISDILLPGAHNVDNYMTAIALTHGLVRPETVRNTAKTFKGVEHRCELVRIKDGVRYYNSSIDSSPTRTAAALNAFKEKVIVICGGYDKHIPFDPMAPLLAEHAKRVVLTGATASKIKAVLDAYKEAGNDIPEIIEESDFDCAFRTAAASAESGDIVILSPACASFDAFPNFEARGRHFKELVNSL